MPDTPKTLFEVNGLHAKLRGKEILHNVSFSVERGSICGLLGPNGAGKTTLFKSCLSFIKHSGQVLINGIDTATLSTARLARLVAYVPQEHKQAFGYTVRETVSMGRSPHLGGMFGLKKTDQAIVEAAMQKMGIMHLAESGTNDLSGGQRQLTLIARALAQEAPLLILDEPTSALDFSNQIVVWKALKSIAASGLSVLVCSHDPNHILWFCDHVLILNNGRKCFEGSAEALINTPILQELYGSALSCTKIGELPVIYPRF